MKKVYLSGKIAGLPEEEYRDNFAQASIAALDFFPGEQVTIVNPAELPAIHNSWADYLLRDLMLLKDCDAIVMLPNWMQSKGAMTEHAFACGMGIDIFYLPKPNEIVVSADEMNRLSEMVLPVIRAFEQKHIAIGKVLKDGMLRYDNPPSNETKENQEQ